MIQYASINWIYFKISLYLNHRIVLHLVLTMIKKYCIMILYFIIKNNISYTKDIFSRFFAQMSRLCHP